MGFLIVPILLAGIVSPGSARVGPDTIQMVERLGRAPVIVMLREPEIGTASVERRRARIAAMEQNVLDAVAGTDFVLRSRWRSIAGFAGTIGPRSLAILSRRADVRRIDIDAPGSGNLNQSRPLIGADLVEQMGYTGEGVRVAVLDTGAAVDHPDLSSKIVAQACYCTNADFTGCCPDGTTSQFGDGAAFDGNGHGSNVSGIIAGEGTIAPRGMAPGVTIVAVKVIDDNNSFAYSSQVIDGMDWVATNHPEVRVVNMSLGTSARFGGYCDEIYSYTMAYAAAVTALRDNGAVVFVSAGNDADSAQIEAPACVEHAVAVGAVYDANLGSRSFNACSDATTAADQITCFSNSSPALDLLAPGAAITAVGRTGVSTYYGTSQAAPHCSGLAALMIEADPAIANDEIEAAMKATGKPITDSRNGRTTPRIDAFAAVRQICHPPAITDEPVNATITAGRSATLEVAAEDATDYQWYQVDGPDASGDTSHPVGSGSRELDTGALPAGTFYFWVRVANMCNSDDSRVATVTVHAHGRRHPVRRPG